MATSISKNLKLTLEDNDEFIGIEKTAENFQKVDEAFGGLDQKIKEASAMIFVNINKNGSTTSADKTFAEVKAEIEKGNSVFAVLSVANKLSGGRLMLSMSGDTALTFGGYFENSLWLVQGTASGWSVIEFSPAANAHKHVQDDINGLTTALNKKAPSTHSHNEATQSAAGFLSASDKKKLDGVAEGANKTTVDSKISETSTNPVQTKAICAWVKKQISNAFLVDEGGTAS